MRPIISLILTLIVTLVSACTPVRVSRPVIVGTPGPVYRSTDSKFAVHINNNMDATLSLEVGQTQIATVKTGATYTINLCDRNFWGRVLSAPGSQSRVSRVITVKAIGADSTYIGMESKTFTADCYARSPRELVWTVQSVRKIGKVR